MMARPDLTSRGSLQQPRIPQQHAHHRIGIADIVSGIKSQLLELGVLAHQVLHRIFQLGDHVPEDGLFRRVFHIADFNEINARFGGDRHGVARRASMRIVI